MNMFLQGVDPEKADKKEDGSVDSKVAFTETLNSYFKLNPI